MNELIRFDSDVSSFALATWDEVSRSKRKLDGEARFKWECDKEGIEKYQLYRL